MRRRAFVIGAISGAAAVGSALAQSRSKAVPRVGYISPGAAPDPNVESFRQGMRKLGYVEGQTYHLDVRYAERIYDRFPALTDELVRSGVDVMVLVGPAARSGSAAGRPVPTVFMFSGDAVEAGFVESLPRPGGNVTGMSYMVLDLAAKRLDILKEAVPGLSRIGVLSNPMHPGERGELRVTLQAADRLGLAVDYRQIGTAADFAPTIAEMVRGGCNGFTAFSEVVTIAGRQRLVDLVAQARLPSIFGLRAFADAGGLMSYGPIIEEAHARLAVYVDKILRGVAPAELPVEEPATFEFVVNAKTAKSLGLEIPGHLLARADEVIE